MHPPHISTVATEHILHEVCVCMLQVKLAMAQQVQGQFGYRTIQLLKTDPLGTGSYGAVYKAMCDDLPCAGKILHPTLIQSGDPGAMAVMKRFQQECSFLSAIRHPNIVQYLGSYQDPETRLPVLLMELMDDSLTRFLEQSKEPLPYHTQVDICHDIALALAYLHSNGIIHRDLSSNNVLLIAGSRAKVTDFGMAKIFNMNHTTMSRLTMCPGTTVYMSPEALEDPPRYTKKLDSFSFGVLGIQVITRQFPDPGPRVKKINNPESPTGKIEMPVLEMERRKSQTDSINPYHPLLRLATDCLSYNEEDRPSAQDLCHHLTALKEAPPYGDSVQQAQERSRPAESAPADREDRERQMKELQEQKQELHREKVKCDEQLQRLQQQLQVCGDQVREKDAVIAARERELQEATREKDHVIESRERQLRELNQQLAASEKGTAQLQQNLLQREKMVQELQERVRTKDQLLQQLVATQKGLLNLTWKTCKAAPHAVRRGSAAVHGNTAAFRPARAADKSCVPLYNSDTEQWSTLPQCPKEYFTLTVVNGLVTAVGGMKSGRHTNTLLSFVEEQWKREWVKRFPPMPTKRALTAVVCSGKALVVAGGWREGDRLTTVEVMDTDTLQWSSASSLPHGLSDASATVCGDRVYLVAGIVEHGHSTKTVLACSLSGLLQSQPSHSVWHTIADLPVIHLFHTKRTTARSWWPRLRREEDRCSLHVQYCNQLLGGHQPHAHASV